MSTNSKSVVLAAVLAVATLGLMVILVKTSGAGAGAAGSEHAAAGRVAPAVQPTSELRGEMRGGPEGRAFFASRMQSRFTRQGKRIRVEAVGSDKTSFQMTWEAGSADQQHIERLKAATPFQHELRGRGFRSLVLRVGPRVVWSLELR